jgi:hypothetical protein
MEHVSSLRVVSDEFVENAGVGTIIFIRILISSKNTKMDICT